MKTKLALLAIGSSLFLLGCYVERPHGYVRGPDVSASYSYEYYPDVEVYFEPQRQVYYWSEGGAWRSGPRAPHNLVLRSPVRVALDSPEPYKHHDEVRTKYPRQQHEEKSEHKHQANDQR